MTSPRRPLLSKSRFFPACLPVRDLARLAWLRACTMHIHMHACVNGNGRRALNDPGPSKPGTGSQPASQLLSRQKLDRSAGLAGKYTTASPPLVICDHTRRVFQDGRPRGPIVHRAGPAPLHTRTPIQPKKAMIRNLAKLTQCLPASEDSRAPPRSIDYKRQQGVPTYIFSRVTARRLTLHLLNVCLPRAQ